jgi:hypothetical protein
MDAMGIMTAYHSLRYRRHRKRKRDFPEDTPAKLIPCTSEKRNSTTEQVLKKY